MEISKKMGKLKTQWIADQTWPKRLEWLEITGLRGWKGHRINFNFPMVAIVGENGSGKSTILQAAAAIYRSSGKGKKTNFASDYFLDTTWDKITNASIEYSVGEGKKSHTGSVRKPSDRWRGNPGRRERTVYYIDLSRIQPLAARTGYLRLAKATSKEGKTQQFEEETVKRLSSIMGSEYKSTRLASTVQDESREVPVVERRGVPYSGFHQGAGELTAAELLGRKFEKYSLVIIDEIESSLHPRAQRRLVRNLAEVARKDQIQFIISTHSPYVLQEFPPEGRICILDDQNGKTTVTGVSPEFAMSRMDDDKYPECDVYVEDDVASSLVMEAIADTDLFTRVQVIPFGSAEVGFGLGMMLKQKRFPKPVVVFVDGDQKKKDGVCLLPGTTAPERLVFAALKGIEWKGVSERTGRSPSTIIDALDKAMTIGNHHEWLKSAADELHLGKQHLWQVLAAIWIKECATEAQKDSIVDPIREALDNI